MAKRRKIRASPRRSLFRVKTRSKRRTTSGSSNPTSYILPAMLYGAGRAPIAKALDPILAKIPIPIGALTDEVGLGVLSYFLAKKSKNPFIKKVALSGLIVESARTADYVVQGGIMNFGSSKVEGDSYVYG